MEEKYILGVLVGNRSASEEAESMNRPFCALSVDSRDTVVRLFTIPLDHRWWLQLLEEKPQLAGLTQAEVFFAEKVNASSPWTRKEVKPDAPVAPCGTDCRTCPSYQKQCRGCPATKYYVKEDDSS